ncbi:hypothetical protein KKG66_09455 [bacterium]|nr:hypothetical protein [bacterium]
MRNVLGLGLVLVLGLGVGSSFAVDKTFGKDVTMAEAVSIASINEKPADFADKDVLVTGKVVGMCMHSGCWVMIESGKDQILCRSLDESVHFSPNVMERPIRLEGKLLWDKNAPGMEMKAHEGKEPHACPNPQVMVSVAGAVVDLAEAEAADEPKAEAEPEAEPKAE